MHHDFWATRWREGRIGFHRAAPTPQLVAHAARLSLEGARVLVPLCGKSVDLAWLAARAREVVGVELVPSAVEAFFAEQGLTPRRRAAGTLEAFEVPGLTVLAGDYFALDPATTAPFDVCFDRAAMVALPPAMRARYVAHTRALLAPGARTLLITLEHDGPTDEPPFSIPEAEVRAAFAASEVTVLHDAEVSDALPQRGAAHASEHVYLIER